MGVRERAMIIQATPADIIEVSSISSYSSAESLNTELALQNEREKQRASRRNLKGWLKKNKRVSAPTAETHMKASSLKHSRRAGRIKGQLLCLAEINEADESSCEGKPLDIYSFVDCTASAFTSVVTDSQLLQDWNETLQLAVHQSMIDDAEDSYDWCTDFDNAYASSPALNPELCYRRIGKSARAQLNMPYKHHEALTGMEQELIDWFCAFPDSIMIKCMKSPYERLLFHSVCRYMQLSSYSVSHGKVKSVNPGDRKTYVQNSRDNFYPPKLLLSEYLPKLTLEDNDEEHKCQDVEATLHK